MLFSLVLPCLSFSNLMKDLSRHIQYKKNFSHSVDSTADLRILFEVMLLSNAESNSCITIPDGLAKYFKVSYRLSILAMK